MQICINKEDITDFWSGDLVSTGQTDIEKYFKI